MCQPRDGLCTYIASNNLGIHPFIHRTGYHESSLFFNQLIQSKHEKTTPSQTHMSTYSIYIRSSGLRFKAQVFKNTIKKLHHSFVDHSLPHSISADILLIRLGWTKAFS